ncbi:MAG TPA: hypothetical protein ENK49_14300, partial [Gammaproteobacteria bacterium]|nr:hypothetical protein [Gammaproteobacteria bacterium]
MKVAVVGGGPTAFGALARLVALKQAGQALDIHVYTSGQADQEDQIDAAYQPRYSDQDVNAILRVARTAGGGGIVPPRIFHRQALQDHVGHGLKTNIKISDTFGGIGNYWSSSIFPAHAFTDPVAAVLGELDTHYRFIAGRIPVAGTTRGELDHFFDTGSVNHPPIDVAAGLAKLQCRRDNADDSGMDLAIGINRFALNTHAGERNGCIQCGDCLYGCPRDALFRAARPIAEFANNGQCRITFEKVYRVKSRHQQVRLTTRRGDSDYDKVFLCAGALGTIELLGRSYESPQKPVYLYDNLLWYFPVFSLWPRRMRFRDRVFAFAELAGGIFNHADQTYNHLLISTLPDAVMDKMLSRNRLSR